MNRTLRRLNPHLSPDDVRALTRSERDEQQAFVAWCHTVLVKYDWRASLTHAIPNALGAKRRPEAGTLPGVPDVFLPIPIYRPAAGRFSAGLYVEMKAEGGSVSSQQAGVFTRLRAAGFEVEVCYGAARAADSAIRYLGLSPDRFDLSNL